MAEDIHIVGFIGFMLSQKAEISNIGIRKLKYKVEKRFPEFYIPMTRDDLYESCGVKFPEMFKWFDTGMERATDSEAYFTEPYLSEFLKIWLPEKVLTFLREECVLCTT